MSDGMRLFIGIELDGQLRARLAHEAGRLSARLRGSFSATANYHITLAFLGGHGPEELAAMFTAQRGMGLKTGMLVTNPIPVEYAMDKATIDAAIDQAMRELREQGVHGKETTPFLLARVVELTGGDSLESNIQLVLNNARLASKTAAALCR